MPECRGRSRSLGEQCLGHQTNRPLSPSSIHCRKARGSRALLNIWLTPWPALPPWPPGKSLGPWIWL